METDDLRHEAIIAFAEAAGDLEVLENAITAEKMSIQKVISALDGFIEDLKERRGFFDFVSAKYFEG